MRIPTTDQIRALETNWIKDCGNNWGQVLMEIAGRAAAIRTLRIWQDRPGPVTVVCGKGNNGGDGLVVARYLRLWGIPVNVLVLERKQRETKKTSTKSKSIGSDNQSTITLEKVEFEFSTPEANTNLKILKNLSIDVEVIDSLKEVNFDEVDSESDSYSLDPEADSLFQQTSLIVDAIFGTGLDREIEGLHRRVIESINRSGKPVISIDMPSGINSDTGQIMGAAVRADVTVTFGYLKPGLLNFPGNTIKGDLSIVDIGLPELPEAIPDINLSTVEMIKEMLPMRPIDAHKGTFGQILTIAGSKEMMGAATLAGLSSLKTGAGLSYLALPDSIPLNSMAPELICHSLPSSQTGSLSLKAYDWIKEQLEKVNAIVLGPGLTTSEETVELVCKLVSEINIPCVIDADGLNALSIKKAGLNESSRLFVLTPHPKELARLMELTTSEIQADRVGACLAAAKKYDCTVLLKGAMTVIANQDSEIFINPTGNPGMATAGAGDVLSGIIGGLLAQRVDPFQAAVTGAYLHGRAGDLLESEIGEAGIIAGDLARVVPLAIKSVQENERSTMESHLLEGDSP